MGWFSALKIRPELLGHHALIYARLFEDEGRTQLAHWWRIATLQLAAWWLCVTALSLLGVALLLLAFLPWPLGLPALLLLLVVPATPLLAALLLWRVGKQMAATPPVTVVWDQLKTDLSLLQKRDDAP